LRQHFKLLVGARVFAGKTQKFEEKGAPASVGGIISHFGAQRLESFSQAASSV